MIKIFKYFLEPFKKDDGVWKGTYYYKKMQYRKENILLSVFFLFITIILFIIGIKF